MNLPHETTADVTQAVNEFTENLAGLRVKPVLFRPFHLGRFVPIEEDWANGTVDEVGQATGVLPYDHADIRILARERAPLPRQSLVYTRWSALLAMRKISGLEPFTEGRMIGVATVEHSQGPEGRRMMPVVGFIDVNRPDDPSTYSLSLPDLAILLHQDKARLAA